MDGYLVSTHMHMATQTIATRAMRKITISIPEELVRFTDDRARKLGASRSHVIGLALAEAKERDEQRLAAEGYRFYADEAHELDEPSSKSTTKTSANVTSANVSGEAASAAWEQRNQNANGERPSHGD